MNDKTKLPQNVQKNCLLVQSALAGLRNTTEYTTALSKVRIDMDTVVVALTIANKCLDLTLSDEANMFFHSSQDSLAIQILSEINEKSPVDVVAIKKLVFPLWLSRHRLAMGLISPWQYITSLNDVLPVPQAKMVIDVYKLLEK